MIHHNPGLNFGGSGKKTLEHCGERCISGRKGGEIEVKKPRLRVMIRPNGFRCRMRWGESGHGNRRDKEEGMNQIFFRKEMEMFGLPTILRMNREGAKASLPNTKRPTTDCQAIRDSWTGCSFCGTPTKLEKEVYSQRRGVLHYLIWPLPCTCPGSRMARLMAGGQ